MKHQIYTKKHNSFAMALFGTIIFDGREREKKKSVCQVKHSKEFYCYRPY